jgi:hypothetical protein
MYRQNISRTKSAKQVTVSQALALAALFVSAVLFQNCSPVDFARTVPENEAVKGPASDSGLGGGVTTKEPHNEGNVSGGSEHDDDGGSTQATDEKTPQVGSQPAGNPLQTQTPPAGSMPSGASDPATDSSSDPVGTPNGMGPAASNFNCLKYEAVSVDQLDAVPARSTDGICFYIKIFDAIPSSSSAKFSQRDLDVLSRNHDINADDPRQISSPHVMGRFEHHIRLLGERKVLLSGGPDVATGLQVDNFMLYGIFPQEYSLAGVWLNQFYRASGSSDSTIAGSNGANSGKIFFRGSMLPLEAFTTGGVSTIAPVSLSDRIPPMTDQILDLRMLDCGAIAQLSDVYLLFQ